MDDPFHRILLKFRPLAAVGILAKSMRSRSVFFLIENRFERLRLLLASPPTTAKTTSRFKTFALGATLLIPALFTACDPEQARRQYTQDDTKVEVARDVEILYSDSAVVRVRITAPTLEYYVGGENPRQEFPDGIKVEFLNAARQVRSILTAKSAIRQPDKGLVYVRDSVVLTTVEQEKLETEELIWNEKDGKISTEKFVKVTKPGEVIYGFGLEANQDFSFWKMTVPKGTIKSKQLDNLTN